MPNRGTHDEQIVWSILDSAFLAHVGFVVQDQPYVIPTLFGREGNILYLHGSAASRMLKHLQMGAPACVTVTQVDALVLARSAFHHSMNYRSVIAFGTGKLITDEVQKLKALRVISEQVIKGRWDEVRTPNARELAATAVIEFAMEEAGAKIRNGPPSDDVEDRDLPIWAGIIPLGLAIGEPVPDPHVQNGHAIPHSVGTFRDGRLDAVGRQDVVMGPNAPLQGVGEA